MNAVKKAPRIPTRCKCPQCRATIDALDKVRQRDRNEVRALRDSLKAKAVEETDVSDLPLIPSPVDITGN